MRTKVRKIGNSYGILLSKKVLEQANIKGEVALSLVDNKIVIEAINDNPKEGWEEALLKANSLNDKEVFFENFNNQFDEEEWIW